MSPGRPLTSTLSRWNKKRKCLPLNWWNFTRKTILWSNLCRLSRRRQNTRWLSTRMISFAPYRLLLTASTLRFGNIYRFSIIIGVYSHLLRIWDFLLKFLGQESRIFWNFVPGNLLRSNAIKGENFILEFSEIFPINGTFFNGDIGEINHFILDFPKIFPFNGVPCNGVRLYFRG